MTSQANASAASAAAGCRGHLDRVPGSVNGGDPVDLPGNRQQSARILDVKAFDQLAVDQHDALTGGGRFRMRGDDAARPFDLFRARRISSVGRCNLLGVDQRLAVKAELAALTARKSETFFVGQIEMDAVEDREPISPGGEQSLGRAR